MSRILFATLLCALTWTQSSLAAPVTYLFNGNTQATVGTMFFPSLDFTINFTIDSDAVDQFPMQQGRGAFSGGQALVSIPDIGLVDGISTNVTGLLLEDFGSLERLRLVDPSNFFGSAGIAAQWNSGGAIADPTVVSPLLEPVPPVDNDEGGLTWQFDNFAQNVTFNSVAALSVENGATAVPEPSAIGLCLIGVTIIIGVTRNQRRRHDDDPTNA